MKLNSKVDSLFYEENVRKHATLVAANRVFRVRTATQETFEGKVQPLSFSFRTSRLQ